MNNRLSVGAGGGVGGALLYLENIPAGKPMTLGQTLTIVQHGCQYSPHVTAAPVGSTIQFVNGDDIPHNVRVETLKSGQIIFNRAQARNGMSDSLRLDRKIDPRTLHSGKIDTNADTTFATIGVDRRSPTVRREGKSRTRQFLRHIMQRFVQPAQFDTANWIHRDVNLAPVRSVFNPGAVTL